MDRQTAERMHELLAHGPKRRYPDSCLVCREDLREEAIERDRAMLHHDQPEPSPTAIPDPLGARR